MTKRKLLATIFALTMSVSLSACSSKQSKSVSVEDIQFETIAKEKLGQKTFYVLYDADNMEMYTFVKYNGDVDGQLSAIYNADGTPMIFSPEEE